MCKCPIGPRQSTYTYSVGYVHNPYAECLCVRLFKITARISSSIVRVVAVNVVSELTSLDRNVEHLCFYYNLITKPRLSLGRRRRRGRRGGTKNGQEFFPTVIFLPLQSFFVPVCMCVEPARRVRPFIHVIGVVNPYIQETHRSILTIIIIMLLLLLKRHDLQCSIRWGRVI